MIIANIT